MRRLARSGYRARRALVLGVELQINASSGGLHDETGRDRVEGILCCRQIIMLPETSMRWALIQR